MHSSSVARGQRGKKVNLTILGVAALLGACGSEHVPNANMIRSVYERHDLPQARTLLDRALKAEPENAELRLLSGKIALETGNLEYAQAELERISSDPQLGGQARSLLAKAYFLNGNSRKALDVLGSVDPSDGLGFGIKALALATQGDEAQAESVLAAGLAKYPNSPDLILLSAMAAFASGDLEVALERSQEALRLKPNDLASLTFSVRLALAQQDQGAALSGVEAILRVAPDNNFALMTKAAMRYDAGDRAGAAALFRKAAQNKRSNMAMPRYFQAQMAFDQGQYKQASALLATIPEPRDFLPAARLKGILASYNKRNEEAISLLQYYLEQGGEDGLARYALAVALGRVGDVGKALQYLRPVAEAPNANASTRALMAKLTALTKDPAAGQGPAADTQSEQQMRTAEAALVTSNWQKAGSIYDALLRANPQTQDRRLLNNAALARQMGGDLAGAERLIRRAMVVAPGDPVVLDTAAWILFKKNGWTPEADALSRRAAVALPGERDVQFHARTIAAAR